MQAAFQRGTDNGISARPSIYLIRNQDDVRRAYLLAWDLSCKGITIFRDGSKGEQVLNVGVKDPATRPGEDANSGRRGHGSRPRNG